MDADGSGLFEIFVVIGFDGIFFDVILGRDGGGMGSEGMMIRAVMASMSHLVGSAKG